MKWMIQSLSLLAAVALVGSGCGSKEAEETAATPAAPAAESTEAGEAAPAEETASSNNEESTTESIVIPQMDVQETLSASDSAAKSKNWTGATENLVKLQLSGSMKTDAESWQYNQRMTALQNQLIEAADAGDPKAKAAIEMLRRTRRIQ